MTSILEQLIYTSCRKSTDLTKVTEEYEEEMRKKKQRERDAKDEEERRRIEDNDRRERQMESEAMERSLEFTATTERMRAMFFGRPAQQIRLLKRDCQVNPKLFFTFQQAIILLSLYQIERNKAEYYCSAWTHLMEDSQEERQIQIDIIHRATKQKSDAAARADSLRGKEKGARQAALYLKGCQLHDASEKSRIAADQFGAEAADEEQKARIARAELEDAEENKLIEEEKINACKVQIKYNQKLAKKALEEAIQRERDEIRAVMDEEDRLIKARPTFDDLLANNAPLSSLAKSYQDDIDKIDRRLALIAMEQEMFCPSYLVGTPTQTSFLGKGKSKPVTIFVAARAKSVPVDGKKYEILERDFEWIDEKQTPGTTCLGRRGVEENGLLFQRSIVVTAAQELCNPFKSEELLLSQTESLQLSGNQKNWIKLVKLSLFERIDFPKLSAAENQILRDAQVNAKVDAQERWRNFGRENLNEMQTCISITSDYFAKDDLFISRANFKSKQAKTLLDKKLFGRMWEQKTCITARTRLHLATKADEIVQMLEKDQMEKNHEPEPKSSAPGSSNIVKLDRVTVRLRHCPKHLWRTTYTERGKAKPLLSVLNNSSFLGPKLSGYLPVSVPNLHVDDKSADGIDDVDGRPRLYAIISDVKVDLNRPVKKGADLIVLRVFDERKMTPEMRNRAAANKRKGPPGPETTDKTRPWELASITIKSPADGKFTGLCPAVWKQKEFESAKIRNDLQLFDWNKPKTHGYLDHTWLADEKSTTSDDLLHSYNLKVFSFEKIAFIEQSEDKWQDRILPVFEWPDIFFKDFNHFFVR